MELTLKLLDKSYSVCRMNTGELIPEWAQTSDFFSITKTEDELSVVCESADVPEEVLCEKDWRIIKIEGPLDFSLTGILFAITKVLYEENISIFAISTYDTDYIMVRAADANLAVSALKRAGYNIL